jgi:Flp pilus assembly protein TadB
MVLALAVVALAGGWFWWMRSRSADAEAHLRRICFGDQSQVERLIQGEMRRTAGEISRAEAARRAVDRHRRDNR